MSWVKQLIEHLHDSWDIIVANPLPYIIFCILCIGLLGAIISFINKRSKEKIESFKEKIESFKEKIELLKEENLSLKDQLNKQKMECEDLKASLQNSVGARLFMGFNAGEISSSAENLSKHISDKYSSNE